MHPSTAADMLGVQRFRPNNYGDERPLARRESEHGDPVRQVAESGIVDLYEAPKSRVG